MHPDHEILFSPLTVKKWEFKNRIVAPPFVQLRDLLSPEYLAWYRRLASGGVGLVIVEATGVPHFEREITVENLKPLVDIIHEGGAKAAIQLFPTRFGEDKEMVIDDISEQTLQGYINQYAVAAKICRDAGFDGVEPHGAHSYLINRFFKPDQNHRTDRFGGSLEGRCELGVEIVRSIKQAIGEDMLILYRHTPVGKEYGIEDSFILVEKLIEAGLDILDISPGQDKEVADLARPFAEKFDVPVITVKGMENPDDAAGAIKAGWCNMVAVGRQLIADAQWPKKVAAGKMNELINCQQCNEGCFGNLKAGQPVVCTFWEDDEIALYTR